MQYSILADGLWLEEEDEQLEERVELEVEGITMEIKVDSINSGEIIRIISSNPTDYLKAHYQPGTKIEFKPTFS